MRKWRPGVTNPSTSILLVLLEQKTTQLHPPPWLSNLLHVSINAPPCSAAEVTLCIWRKLEEGHVHWVFWSFVWSLCDITPLKSLFHNILLASLGKAAGWRENVAGFVSHIEKSKRAGSLGRSGKESQTNTWVPTFKEKQGKERKWVQMGILRS